MVIIITFWNNRILCLNQGDWCILVKINLKIVTDTQQEMEVENEIVGNEILHSIHNPNIYRIKLEFKKKFKIEYLCIQNKLYIRARKI